MPISQKSQAGLITASPPGLPYPGERDTAFLAGDVERRFVALVRESTRRRIAQFGTELVRLGEEVQRMAAVAKPRRPATRSHRQLH